MFQDIFSINNGETVLILIDKPHDDIFDTPAWKNRRDMAHEWYEILKEMGEEKNFSVEFKSYPATGLHNSPLPDNIQKIITKRNLIFAMNEYSASASLAFICQKKDSITRCASMPRIEKRMEKTALQVDYKKLKHYAEEIAKLLNKAVSANISFSTGDTLSIDLRNRNAMTDNGQCWYAGQMINLPSGEACKAPYEAADEEKKSFGISTTSGILPVFYEDEILTLVVKENRITHIRGHEKKKEKFSDFFKKNETRRNIAELGIGCNPNAVVTGNVLEDEKVPGLHIAYGTSAHIGGKIISDMHQDICYPKGAPVEATTLVLTSKNGEQIELISDTSLQFHLFE
jgi:hypothetical protein